MYACIYVSMYHMYLSILMCVCVCVCVCAGLLLRFFQSRKATVMRHDMSFKFSKHIMAAEGKNYPALYLAENEYQEWVNFRLCESKSIQALAAIFKSQYEAGLRPSHWYTDDPLADEAVLKECFKSLRDTLGVYDTVRVSENHVCKTALPVYDIEKNEAGDLHTHTHT